MKNTLIPVKHTVTIYEDHPVAKLIYKRQNSKPGNPSFHCPSCDAKYSALWLDTFATFEKYMRCTKCGQWLELPNDYWNNDLYPTP